MITRSENGNNNVLSFKNACRNAERNFDDKYRKYVHGGCVLTVVVARVTTSDRSNRFHR